MKSITCGITPHRFDAPQANLLALPSRFPGSTLQGIDREAKKTDGVAASPAN